MTDKISHLLSRNFFSARRETSTGVATALRYFQGANHVLASVGGPEHFGTADMHLLIRVTILPRTDNPFLVHSTAQKRFVGGTNRADSVRPDLWRALPSEPVAGDRKRGRG